MQLQHAVPSPSSQSLAFRSNLAKLISPLKRVKPSVPFWQLGAHRVPTLWGLYRGLLRAAPSDNIRHRIQVAFRKNRHLTGIEKTKKELVKGHKWLKTFQHANSGDVKKQALLTRYDRFIEMKIEKEDWKQTIREEFEWLNRLRNRSILTGSFIHPTAYNPPLPRLKPQPPAISGMIVTRMESQNRRHERIEALEEMKNLIREESFFEQQNRHFRQYSGTSYHEWIGPLESARKEIVQTNRGVMKRMLKPFPQALLDQVREARRNKTANKTKERERERRGEVLKRTLERRRKGLPAPIWDKLPERNEEGAIDYDTERFRGWIRRGIEEEERVEAEGAEE
ncbi:hypothetical protein D9758_001396 [Tetrapyrgos nigripes]|uniref:Complex 1 LYR protein domain-containing protein n=1 Tax=Tetrapyrgos nigripes TaxID=182062 RepID=A0A8H5LUG4_9AGAR|nr:hypothetical protein D9758_001396 [Tetrapyrgos nigripes]